MMWRAGPGGELTWHAGPARGCDVALRPRGRATAGPREAQVALTRGKRPPNGSTRTPRKDALWHRRVRTRRAHGYSGALVKVGDGNAMQMKGVPLFNRRFSPYFFRVGLCSHTVLPCKRRGRVASVGSHRGRLQSR